MNRSRIPAVIVAVPIVLANVVAMIGQYAFLREHLRTWGVPGAILFAAALESIAIYLAGMAHAALMNGDSASRLRIGSYAFGAMIGGMNFSHYARNGHVTFAAIGLGLLSASSPWLWAIYSRRQSRDALMERGLIEGHAVRLGANRWLLHPLRSFRVFSRATWLGENDPANAIALIEPLLEVSEIKPPALRDVSTKADAVRFAVSALAALDHGDKESVTVPQVASWLQDHADDFPVPDWQISPSYVADVLRRDAEARARIARAQPRALPAGSGDE